MSPDQKKSGSKRNDHYLLLLLLLSTTHTHTHAQTLTDTGDTCKTGADDNGVCNAMRADNKS